MRLALALLMVSLPLVAARKPTVAQLETQVKRLTEERDGLKQRLAAVEDIQQELGAALKARDLARTESAAAQREADQLRTILKESQGGGDAMLKELREARQAATEAGAESARLKVANEALLRKVTTLPGEGDLVVLGEDIQPARAINLNRVTPHVKSSGLFALNPKGVVVVQVLISEKGDVLAARLIQGLPGEASATKEAGEACVEAAKHLVFDPAASKDGKTHFKVWQGVGFYLD